MSELTTIPFPASGLRASDASAYGASVLAWNSSSNRAFAIGEEIDGRACGMLTSNSESINKACLQSAIDGLGDSGGGIITLREQYDSEGGIELRSGVYIRGIGPVMKGVLPANGETPAQGVRAAAGGLRTTDNTQPLFLIPHDVHGIGFHSLLIDYPDQPLLTDDPTSDLITYYPTLKKLGFTTSVSVVDCAFCGATSCIDLSGANDDVDGDKITDLLIEGNYSWPLGGFFLDLRYCRDIPRIWRNHVNMSIGLTWRGGEEPAHASAVSYEVRNHVNANGEAIFYIQDTDELMMLSNFVFIAKDAYKFKNVYGSVIQCNADMVRVGIDYEPGADYRHLYVGDCSFIISGQAAAGRTAIKVRGNTAGRLIVGAINARTANDPGAVGNLDGNDSPYIFDTAGSTVSVHAATISAAGGDTWDAMASDMETLSYDAYIGDDVAGDPPRSKLPGLPTFASVGGAPGGSADSTIRVTYNGQEYDILARAVVPTAYLSDSFTGSNGTDLSGRSPDTAGSNAWAGPASKWLLNGSGAAVFQHAGDYNSSLLRCDAGVTDATWVLTFSGLAPGATLQFGAASDNDGSNLPQNGCFVNIDAAGYHVYDADGATYPEQGSGTLDLSSGTHTVSITVSSSGASVSVQVDSDTPVVFTPDNAYLGTFARLTGAGSAAISVLSLLVQG